MLIPTLQCEIMSVSSSVLGPVSMPMWSINYISQFFMECYCGTIVSPSSVISKVIKLLSTSYFFRVHVGEGHWDVTVILFCSESKLWY